MLIWRRSFLMITCMQRMAKAHSKVLKKLFQDAMEKYRNGALDEAARLLGQYVANSPDSADANYYLGLCLSEQWKLAAADKFLRKALS